ncbi:MAG: phosphoribosyl-AMP cyclohydrolase [Verrucomicrobiota bacterium]
MPPHPLARRWRMAKELEEGSALSLDFGKLKKIADTGADVVPAIAQDVDSGEVLIVGYANQLALDTAQREQKATFWSTSRNELWIKGKTSGDFLELIEIRVNCEQNSLLYLVRLAGAGSCHTKNSTGESRLGCYYRRLTPEGNLEFLEGTK